MSNGEGAHYSHLEIGRRTMNSLTRVAKDTLVIEIYEKRYVPQRRQRTDCKDNPGGLL